MTESDILHAKEIWDVLICFYPSPYGTAALMGNLFAESSLNPSCVTGGGLKTKEQKADYIQKVKNGSIGCQEFAHDGVAFGLVQWRYWSRKEDFWLYCQNHNFEIDDLIGQLNYLHYEISKYKTVEKALWGVNSIRDISDLIMERYLKPGNMTEQAKAKRAKFGQEYYDLFATEPIVPMEKYIITTAPKVLLRDGNGKHFQSVTRAEKQGTKFKWVATAENGWHAIEVGFDNTSKTRVLWISPDYSKLQSG